MSEKLEFLKNCFENEEEYKKFAQKVDDNGIKIADLTSGEYVAKKKFDDKATELSNLQAKYTELEKNSQTDDVSKKKIKAALPASQTGCRARRKNGGRK